MTLTLAAVYAPIAFTPGRTGRLFLEFALTLAGAVIISGFVALTLTPMMCSQDFEARCLAGARLPFHRRGAAPAQSGYRRALRGALRVARWCMLVALGVADQRFLLPQSESGTGADRGSRRRSMCAVPRRRGRPYLTYSPALCEGVSRGSCPKCRRWRGADGRRPARDHQYPGDRPPQRLGRSQREAAGHRQRRGGQSCAASRASAPPPSMRRRFGERGGGRPVEFVIADVGDL